MSNPNTQVLSILHRNRSHASNSADAASGMKTVFIGTGKNQVRIKKLVPLVSPTWQKDACFKSLVESSNLLLDSHTVSDVITMISEEVPMDTTASYQEAQTTATNVVRNFFSISSVLSHWLLLAVMEKRSGVLIHPLH